MVAVRAVSLLGLLARRAHRRKVLRVELAQVTALLVTAVAVAVRQPLARRQQVDKIQGHRVRVVTGLQVQ